jgi:hypothetical protein
MTNPLDDTPSVEFLLLADRAEAISGKLYVMGGAWDRLWLSEFPKQFGASVAIGVLVPWTATHAEHRLTLQIVAADDDEVEIASVSVSFQAGASAQMKRGETQRVVLAFNMAPTFPRPGTYKVKALIDDSAAHGRETVFYVNFKPGTGQ